MEPRRAPCASAPPLAALSYVSLAISPRHSNIRSPSAVNVMNVLTAFTFTYSGEKKKKNYEFSIAQRDSVRCKGGEVEFRSRVTLTLPTSLSAGMLCRFDDQPAASPRRLHLFGTTATEHCQSACCAVQHHSIVTTLSVVRVTYPWVSYSNWIWLTCVLGVAGGCLRDVSTPWDKDANLVKRNGETSSKTWAGHPKWPHYWVIQTA
jgi:hypothetical protein